MRRNRDCDPRAFNARILSNLPDWGLERPEHDPRCQRFQVGIDACERRKNTSGTKQCHAAARYNAFLDCGAGGVQRIVDAINGYQR